MRGASGCDLARRRGAGRGRCGSTHPVRHGGDPGVDVSASLGHAVLGAFSWTFGLASKFILTTIGALVKLLIPRSWANEGVADHAVDRRRPQLRRDGHEPGRAHVYGFAGINALRDLFTWIGVGLLPLTLVYATSRAMLGRRRPRRGPARARARARRGVDLLPVLVDAGGGADRPVTHMVLSLPRSRAGLHKLMLYAVDGVALGRLAADRPRADGRDRDRAARADLPEGRDHPARRAAVRDRAGHDRPGRRPTAARRSRARGQRRRDAARAAGRVGGAVRGRRAADQTTPAPPAR